MNNSKLRITLQKQTKKLLLPPSYLMGKDNGQYKEVHSHHYDKQTYLFYIKIIDWLGISDTASLYHPINNN